MVSPKLLATAKILIVDDDAAILRLYQTILQLEGYSEIRVTPDPTGVLALFVEFDPDFIILDISMPRLSGLALLDMLQTTAVDGLVLPVLVVTAEPTVEHRRQALQGGAVDVLGKPFDCQELVLRIGNLLKIRMAVHDVEAQCEALFQELLHRTEEIVSYQLELKESQLEVIARLGRAGEKRDDVTGLHTQRVALAAGMLATELGMNPGEAEIIQRAAPLHDVGKIGVPDSILLKPGRMTGREFDIMSRHCKIGSELLSGGKSAVVRMAECIALSHHEKWNGGGYPFGLRGENIPLEGRILAVADVFDALTHKRPYKEAWPVEDAVQEIHSLAGTHFDPAIVNAFLRLPHSAMV